MEPEVRHLVQAIHDSPTRLVLVTAGAGSQALSDLLGVPGATRSLLEALVPYSEASFDEFLGQRPAQYVADNTARLMAGRALTRARWLDREGWPVVGLACTATIVTDRPKRGQHRAHLAAWRQDRLACHTLHLQKGARQRVGEEDMVSRLLLNVLAHACELEHELPLPLVSGDSLKIEGGEYADLVEQLQRGQIQRFGLADDGRPWPKSGAPLALFPGAFNPLHEGHLALARTAREMLGHPVTFEVSAVNVDKPPLPPAVVLDRMAQFAGRYPVIVSRAPTFLEKARLYPQATFVVGFDTAERILQPRYYDDSRDNLLAALSEIDARGCRFLVAGRVDDGGDFRQAYDLGVPPPFVHIFHAIPGRVFRNDLSSTELRRQGKKGSR